MIEVTYLDHMGDDLAVVNAARVSFAKEHEEFLDNDFGLVNYLAKHKHKSPFNHAFAKFRVKAPFFVARQLQKHEYMPWNEVSRRYVDDEPELYVPDYWRKRAENVKQGSGDKLGSGRHLYWYNDQTGYDEYLEEFYSYCLGTYTGLLEQGVAPEQARMVLPQSMMTEWIWSGSLYAFAKMCALRLDEHAQYESRLVAEQIDTKMAELFPVSWEALRDNIL